MRRLATLTLSCALAILAAGCASPPSRFYTLSATPAPAAPTSDLSVAVGAVSVPAAVLQRRPAQAAEVRQRPC